MRNRIITSSILVAALLIGGPLYMWQVNAPPDQTAAQHSALDPAVYSVPQTLHAKGLNIIFFADSYQSWEQFD